MTELICNIVKIITMKNAILFLILSCFTCGTTLSQVNTELRINHRLGSQTFQLNATGTNNMTQDFQVTRLEYYVTRITVEHDGGQFTAISDDTVALINAADGTYSSIELGTLNITNVEGVKFHVGVFAPVNNADPSLYAPSHPLAPQSPSMHWGWSAGYRFLVIEGNAGSGFSQLFQLHCLDNANYFETNVSCSAQMDGSTMAIMIDADYARGLENIDVASGPITHGAGGEALTALQNFRDYVFSASSETVGVEELMSNNWRLFPNPANENTVNVQFEEIKEGSRIQVLNVLGQEVLNIKANLSNELTVEKSGQYMVNLVLDGKVISSKKLIRQ